MRENGMEWIGMGRRWDGMGWDGMGWVEMGWDETGRDEESKFEEKSNVNLVRLTSRILI
jgi:hypothetical protein